jgi:hypothetical protein
MRIFASSSFCAHVEEDQDADLGTFRRVACEWCFKKQQHPAASSRSSTSLLKNFSSILSRSPFFNLTCFSLSSFPPLIYLNQQHIVHKTPPPKEAGHDLLVVAVSFSFESRLHSREI